MLLALESQSTNHRSCIFNICARLTLRIYRCHVVYFFFFLLCLASLLYLFGFYICIGSHVCIYDSFYCRKHIHYNPCGRNERNIRQSSQHNTTKEQRRRRKRKKPLNIIILCTVFTSICNSRYVLFTYKNNYESVSTLSRAYTRAQLLSE